MVVSFTGRLAASGGLLARLAAFLVSCHSVTIVTGFAEMLAQLWSNNQRFVKQPCQTLTSWILASLCVVQRGRSSINTAHRNCSSRLVPRAGAIRQSAAACCCWRPGQMVPAWVNVGCRTHLDRGKLFACPCPVAKHSLALTVVQMTLVMGVGGGGVGTCLRKIP